MQPLLVLFCSCLPRTSCCAASARCDHQQRGRLGRLSSTVHVRSRPGPCMHGEERPSRISLRPDRSAAPGCAAKCPAYVASGEHREHGRLLEVSARCASSGDCSNAAHDSRTHRLMPPDHNGRPQLSYPVRRHLVTAEGEVQMPRSPGYPAYTRQYISKRHSYPPSTLRGRQTRAARRLGARSARLRARPARWAPSAAPAAAASAPAAWPRAPSGTPPPRRCLRSRGRALEGTNPFYNPFFPPQGTPTAPFLW